MPRILENPEGDIRECIHVKVKNGYIKSIFYELSDNNCLRASRWLPRSHLEGLLDLFITAVSQAVMLCSSSFVKLDKGILKLKRSKPEMNGPACALRLSLAKAMAGTHSEMKISVDLCSAIKRDFEDYHQLLPMSEKVDTIDLPI